MLRWWYFFKLFCLVAYSSDSWLFNPVLEMWMKLFYSSRIWTPQAFILPWFLSGSQTHLRERTTREIFWPSCLSRLWNLRMDPWVKPSSSKGEIYLIVWWLIVRIYHSENKKINCSLIPFFLLISWLGLNLFSVLWKMRLTMPPKHQSFLAVFLPKL